ncbi:MAG: heavy-metal-associated domain-containing protein [Eubacteriales bacterium]|nr:heavy-metal-associated domain-containing protein [Eubacteriales bacterium]
MKYSFKLKNLGCAACAARMESKINKIPNVSNAKINFIMGKLSFESDEKDISALVQQIQKTISGIESACKITD